MGRMSSNRTPGAGKSGNWRRDACSFILRLASSAVEEGGGADCRGFWEASGLSDGG